MKNILLILSCFLCLVSFVLKVEAQSLCPNVFKCGDTVIDPRDNFKYPTVPEGTQCWFKVNLQAVRFINGDSIPHITNTNVWLSLTSPGWCDYNNDPSQGVIYGHLYNWYVGVDNRGLCPKGWYVPSYNEMMILFNYLGGPNVAGGAMKDTTGWWAPNTGATNSSGLTMLSCGDRNGHIVQWYGEGGNTGCYWSTSWCSSFCGYYYQLNYDLESVGISTQYNNLGGGIRCMRDN